jgi:hypothetical protein
MGVAYAPFEDPPPPPSPPQQLATRIVTQPADATECNYVIMFFIIGMVLIALTDSKD